jgi:hypothetical protein
MAVLQHNHSDELSYVAQRCGVGKTKTTAVAVSVERTTAGRCAVEARLRNLT